MIDSTREEVLDLWHECFDVTPGFTALYFSAKWRPWRARVHREGGRVVASLLLVPYVAVVHGRRVGLAYVAGACTRAGYRGRGIMTRLVASSLVDARASGFALAALVPAGAGLFDFYRRAGFSAVFDLAVVEERDDPRPDASLPPTREATAGEAFAFLSSRVPAGGLRVLHDDADFAAVASELFLSGGAIFAALSPGGAIEGIALAVPDAGKVVVKESAFDTPAARVALSAAVAARWPGYAREWLGATGGGVASRPYGMARVLDVATVARLYAAAFPFARRLFRVTDGVIPANSCDFLIEDGGARRVRRYANSPVQEMDIERLTAFFARADALHPPYMNLMMD